MNNDKYEKLKAKLLELFQLDQPDLDFGIYRVMHATQSEVKKFLEETLPNIVSSAFQSANGAKLAQDFAAAKAAVESNLGASAFQNNGTLNPPFAGTPAGKQYLAAKAALDASAENRDGEVYVYDHLYHFFERYYNRGDFVSLRYLTRETDRKAKPYAIPYAGEEVMLHWANADQYYIKTSENYAHFSVDITKHSVFQKMSSEERVLNGIPSKPLFLHFNVVDAEEGVQGNIKDDKERFFILHKELPCEMKEDGLHVNFEHRADPDKTGKADKWQEELCKKVIAAVVDFLSHAAGGAPSSVTAYRQILSYPCPTEKNQNRTILETYLKRYTSRNTSDYFIHKDLGGFLRRELDFYIKNDPQLLPLDNFKASTPENVAMWLGKVRVFREIADNIITFLAQLENFQKKLWLKKKFVVQCDWCLTLDIVQKYAPELIAEILSNEKQKKEWGNLGFVDSDSLTRMVDTKFFAEDFKTRLLASIPNLDECCDGVIIHSENFQALNLLLERYREQIKCIYIDPPYNSKTTEILYKNTYRDSSWLSLMSNRLELSRKLGEIPIVVAIDENEQEVLSLILKTFYPDYDKTCVSIVHNKKGIQGDYFSFCHEFGIVCIPQSIPEIHGKPIPKEQWEYSNLRKWGRESARTTAKNCFYPIYVKGEEIVGFGDVCDESEHPGKANVVLEDGRVAIYPIETGSKEEKKWRYARDTVESILPILKVVKTKTGELQIHKAKTTETIKTVWTDSRYIAGDYGTKWLTNLGIKVSESLYPKSIYTVEDSVSMLSDEKALILDYFGGSGTTAHAVIDLNREDRVKGIDARRKYILVEMGDHFDTVLKPRIEKVVYSPDWKEGKPLSTDKGISHCFKYLTLESYEDTLNNLVVDSEKGKAFSGLRDYFLKYMLEVETTASPSLLNVENFANPFACRLSVKKPGSEEREDRTVDLVETFNYLIGLRVKHVAAPRRYSATFERAPDPELPEDGNTKLTVKDLRLVSGDEDIASPVWEFRIVEGWCPKNRATPDDGTKERVLVLWRTLTSDQEQDNAVLNAFLQHRDVNALDGEYDVIYVNGSNNVPNLRKDEDIWKVRLIEEDFLARMWEGA